MPRDLPIGNERFLVLFDQDNVIRDLYYPNVGKENHAGGYPFRFGVFVEGADGGRFSWVTREDGWRIDLTYEPETLVTQVTSVNEDLKLVLRTTDCVDFHETILFRKVVVQNLKSEPREVRLFFHHDFRISETDVGDTAAYDPTSKTITHYKGWRYFLCNLMADGAAGVESFATGLKGAPGRDGTWRDAEDGVLGMNPIAQGAVDSVISTRTTVPGRGEKPIYYWMVCAKVWEGAWDGAKEVNAKVVERGPETFIARTRAYWKLWVNKEPTHFFGLSPSLIDLYKRSLLIVRTHVDEGGGIIAANDSDIMQFSRDTYSYVWPRDGALVANALDMAGFPDIARWFYKFCSDVLTDEGYFYHKYNPDGSPASSWHPWVLKGNRAMPIQEDETALVVWALWRHYHRYRDIEFIRPLWVDVVQKAADFMARYRDPRTGLPLPSYDLWEERWGIHAFTVATVYGGLKAAHNFAVCFGDRQKAEVYAKAAAEIKAGAAKYLYSDRLRRFVRRLVSKDIPKPPDSQQYEETSPLTSEPRTEDLFEVDETVDASLFGIYKFHLFEADDPRVISTMKAVEENLWVKTRVGGLARYENDYYHRISNDIATVPGNPWFICTLWLADYYIARAKTPDDLKLALPIFEWTANHALESGVLAEQVNPYTNDPISVSPLTWSHATVVSTAIKYLERLEELQLCTHCHHPIYRLRRRGTVEVLSQAHFDRNDAEFETEESRDTASPVGHFIKEESAGKPPRRVTLSVDTRDCIGCDVCVAHCNQGVLRMVDGKAMVDLRHLNDCDLDGHCVNVCPTNVVSLLVETLEPAAELTAAEASSLDDRGPSQPPATAA